MRLNPGYTETRLNLAVASNAWDAPRKRSRR